MEIDDKHDDLPIEDVNFPLICINYSDLIGMRGTVPGDGRMITASFGCREFAKIFQPDSCPEYRG